MDKKSKEPYESPKLKNHDELVDITACIGSGKGKDTKDCSEGGPGGGHQKDSKDFKDGW
jgi:hypothetical protein